MFSELESLIKYFQLPGGYPLITQKKADYILFKQVALIMKQKQHLTQEGLLNIVKLRASSRAQRGSPARTFGTAQDLNLGLTDVLKSAFPDMCNYTTSGDRPENTSFSMSGGIY